MNMTLPGIDIKFKSGRGAGITLGEDGVVLIPLIGYCYGPAKEFITIDAYSPNDKRAKLGCTIDSDKMLLVREALKNAKSVVVYIPAQGARAVANVAGLKAEAMYGGTRGNALTYVIEDNPASGLMDVAVYLDGQSIEKFEGLKTVGELAAAGSEWIEFSGDEAAELTATAGVNLAGGADGVATNADYGRIFG